MQTILVLIGLAAYYAVVAAALNWWLRRNSRWFTSFLAFVLSQTVLFGPRYLSHEIWGIWDLAALVITSAMCMVVTGVVTLVFRHLQAR